MASITLKSTYASAPSTERGRGTVISVDEKTKKTLVYCSGTNVVLRDVENPMKVEYYTEHANNVTCAKFSPSGYYVVSGDEAGNVRVWASNNADKTLKLETKPLAKTIRDAAWTPDSQRVIVVGEGKSLYGSVFAFDTGSTVGEISGHSASVLSCDMRPQRPFRIATCGEDNSVNFYQGPPFKFSHSNKEHQRFVNGVRFSPDGNYFVTVSSDKTGMLFNGKDGNKIGNLESKDGHTASIYSVAWSPDSKSFVTAAADKTLKIWDAETRTVTKTYKFVDHVDNMQVAVTWATADTIISLSLNGDINYLDPNAFDKPKKVLSGHNKKIYQVVHDEARNKFYTSGGEGTLIRWDPGVGSEGRVQNNKNYNSSIVALGLAGDLLVTGFFDQHVRFVSLANGEFTYSGVEQKLAGVPNDVAVSKNDNTKIIVSTNKGLALFKGSTFVKEWELKFEVTSVALSTDDKELAVGGADKKVHLFNFDENASTLSEVGTFDSHRGKIVKVRYSPDGTMVASGDSNREIFVWDKASRAEKYTGLVFHSASITDLDWSKNSTYLTSCALDRNVIVWDLENKKRVIAEGAHPTGANSVKFINENTVVSVGSDNSMKTFEFKF